MTVAAPHGVLESTGVVARFERRAMGDSPEDGCARAVSHNRSKLEVEGATRPCACGIDHSQCATGVNQSPTRACRTAGSHGVAPREFRIVTKARCPETPQAPSSRFRPTPRSPCRTVRGAGRRSPTDGRGARLPSPGPREDSTPGRERRRPGATTAQVVDESSDRPRRWIEIGREERPRETSSRRAIRGCPVAYRHLATHAATSCGSVA